MGPGTRIPVDTEVYCGSGQLRLEPMDDLVGRVVDLAEYRFGIPHNQAIVDVPGDGNSLVQRGFGVLCARRLYLPLVPVRQDNEITLSRYPSSHVPQILAYPGNIHTEEDSSMALLCVWIHVEYVRAAIGRVDMALLFHHPS